jgi:hypothetical protein
MIEAKGEVGGSHCEGLKLNIIFFLFFLSQKIEEKRIAKKYLGKLGILPSIREEDDENAQGRKKMVRSPSDFSSSSHENFSPFGSISPVSSFEESQKINEDLLPRTSYVDIKKYFESELESLLRVNLLTTIFQHF